MQDKPRQSASIPSSPIWASPIASDAMVPVQEIATPNACSACDDTAWPDAWIDRKCPAVPLLRTADARRRQSAEVKVLSGRMAKSTRLGSFASTLCRRASQERSELPLPQADMLGAARFEGGERRDDSMIHVVSTMR